MSKMLHSEFKAIKNLYIVGIISFIGCGLSIPAALVSGLKLINEYVTKILFHFNKFKTTCPIYRKYICEFCVTDVSNRFS